MGLYNFQQRFVPYILDGSKQHTIRACRKNPEKPGNVCHLYKGLRQKGAQLLLRAPCTRVEEIRINRAQVWIDDVELSLSEKNSLAWRDGFRFEGTVMEVTDPPVERDEGCFDLMLQFWVEKHGSTDFDGHIIHWDWNRREAKS